jgi:predicted HAD superfamily Cof-like phosphohydrolase
MAKCVAGPDGPRLTVDSRGKVQKPKGWTPPDMAAIVAKAGG